MARGWRGRADARLHRQARFGVVTLFLFVTLLFFLVDIVVPGDFVSQFILTGEQAAALREQLGVDRPLFAQYIYSMRSLVTLDLGVSFGGSDVWGSIVGAFAPP